MTAGWQHVVDTGTALLFGKTGASTQPRTVHRVRQEFDTSCGVAVVAMFARVSHAEALAVMFPRARRRTTFYTTHAQVIRALDHFGVPRGPRQRRIRTWDQVPSTALVAARSHHSDGSWHWVILQRRSDGTSHVLDPDVQAGTQRLSSAEQAHLRPISYLAVEPFLPGHERGRQDVRPPRRTQSVTIALERPLASLTVTEARSGGLARRVAMETGLSLGATRARLSRAHGRTLLRNVFRDVWPGEKPPR